MNEVGYNLLMAKIRDLSAQTSFLFTGDDFSVEQDDSVQSSYKGTPEQILKSVFGYDSFRPLQRTVIQNVLDGRDTLAVMPTGGGKSLCYQIPALLSEGLTVVISPLIALMQDQVTQLESFGIAAAFINSSLEWNEYTAVCDRIRRGQIKLLYVSPEGLATERIRDLLHSRNVKLSCITIDEAHCISEWGHDFRPDYMEIASVREEFKGATCLALTATATKQVQNDIVRNLRMENPSVLVTSFNRPNIFLDVRRKNNPPLQVIDFIRSHKGQTGIVYCFSRRQVDELHAVLCESGIKALKYHAGLSDEERSRNQAAFISDRADVIVATVAFGMGINKPDVRYVIHYDMPKSVEQYYQEIGRAGRDGSPAEALLLYSPADIRKIRWFFNENADGTKSEKLLQGMIKYAESHTCRRRQLLSYFGEFNTEATTDQCCDICSSGGGEEKDMTVCAQKFLSCVLRTGERFGTHYVIDVLMGSKASRIIENGHNEISTWGIGRTLDRQKWLELCDCLIEYGLIAKTEEHSVLYVTDAGKQALRSRTEIRLPVSFDENSPKKSTAVLRKAPKQIPDDDKEGKRIEAELRQWRRMAADELNVPPYVIFGDKTLLDIATKKPKSQQELKECYGIGDSKAEKFGYFIIRITKN